MRLPRTRRIYYGWAIVAVVFVTLFVSLGFRYAFGVFFAAILDDTGWTRAATASIFSTSMAVYACTAVFSGILFDRWGPRVLFPVGALLLGAGLILCSLATTIGELRLAYGVLVGLSNACLGFIPHAALLPRWFVRRRGLALGVGFAGAGVGSLVLASASAALIAQLGWRHTLLWMGLGAMGLLVPLNLIVQRSDPASVGQRPDGDPHPGAGAAPPPAPAISPWRALRTPHFWMLFLSVSTVGVVTMTLVVHQPRLVEDMGYSLGLSSFLFGVLGLLRTVGGMLWGGLSDRIGRPACVWIIMGMTFAGLALLALGLLAPGLGQGPRLGLVIAFVFTMGIAYNGLTPVYAAAVAERFGGPTLATILGLLDLGFGTGAALGPWVAGKIYDLEGSYAGVVALLGLAVVLTGVGLVRALPRSQPEPAAQPSAA